MTAKSTTMVELTNNKMQNLQPLLTVGEKVFFVNEKLPYNVMAVSKRYAVVSRRLNKREDAAHLKHMVEMSAYSSFTEAYESNVGSAVYSLIDFEENKRSCDNLVFGLFNYFNENDCKNAIKYLEAGKIELSRRNETELLVDVDRCKNSKK